jgi:aspartate racemase
MFKTGTEKNVIGILGGMGALSSAEFLKTIYEHSSRRFEREQEGPIVALYSDPTFPDRTETFLGGRHELVLSRLVEALCRLCEMGASRIVICCMTMHYLLPELSVEMRGRVLSLPNVIIDRIARSKKKHLLLCSTGTQQLRLFQNHARWATVAEQFVFLNPAEQARLHELIYEIKKGRCLPQTLRFAESLLDKYGLDSYIVGCSEIHILARHSEASHDHRGHYGCVDPFTIIAQKITEES